MEAGKTGRVLLSSDPSAHPGSIGFFPDESGGGFALDAEEARSLTRELSGLYPRLIEPFAEVLERRDGLPKISAMLVARPAVVPLTHCFMDRLLRMRLAVSRRGLAALSVARVLAAQTPARPEHLSELAQNSTAFNQHLLFLLATACGMSVEDVHEAPPRHRVATSQTNHNFSRRSILDRVRGRLATACSRRFGRFPALSMAYSFLPLRDAGLYDRLLSDQSLAAPIEDVPADAGLRRSLLEPAARAAGKTLAPLIERSASGLPPDGLVDAYREFILNYYPTVFFEGVRAHWSESTRRLAPFRAKTILFSGSGDAYSLFMLAAAKAAGMTSVGCQHGVHYGFSDDFAIISELEYAYCDRFISWGWSKPPDSDPKPAEIIPLPSPWLSTQRTHLRAAAQARDLSRSEFDVLLATDKHQWYPPASTGAGIARNDSLKESAAQLESFVAACAGRGVKILHKPITAAYQEAFARTITRIRKSHGAFYSSLDGLEKGLTVDLLQRCRLVLWNQPSTGFAECLVSGIPTMLWWSRLNFKEAPRAEPFFSMLESVGVVHRDPDSFLKAWGEFIRAPESWLQEPERGRSIRDFCREYAWASDDWASEWRTFLEAM